MFYAIYRQLALVLVPVYFIKQLPRAVRHEHINQDIVNKAGIILIYYPHTVEPLLTATPE